MIRVKDMKLFMTFEVLLKSESGFSIFLLIVEEDVINFRKIFIYLYIKFFRVFMFKRVSFRYYDSVFK